MKKLAFFDTKPYDKIWFDKLKSKYDIEFKYFETKLNGDTASLAKGCDGAVCFVNDVVDKEVIDVFSSLGIKFVALRCAGFNNVDLEYAQGKITFARVPAYSPYAVAEFAMGLLLVLVRKIHRAYFRTRDYNFSINGLTGFDLRGKTIGVIGTGKIGKIFIEICKGFGLNIIAYDLYPDKNSDIDYVSLDELFKRSDIVSLHCPLTKDTHYIIRKETIDMMKDGVVILNTSRGALIKAEDLVEGLKSMKIGGACLDVYEEESELFFEDFSGEIIQDDVLARLLSLPNVIITSHQAFLTEEALYNIAETTLANIQAFFEGKVLVNEVSHKIVKG